MEWQQQGPSWQRLQQPGPVPRQLAQVGGQVQQPQDDLSPGRQRSRLALHCRRAGVAEQLIGSVPRRAEVSHNATQQLHATQQHHAAQPLHQSSLEEGPGAAPRTQPSGGALPAVQILRQRSNDCLDPEHQQQEQFALEAPASLPERQQQRSPCSAELKSGTTELAGQRRRVEERHHPPKATQQRGPALEMLPDSDSIEDVLAATADAEETKREGHSERGRDGAEQRTQFDEHALRHPQWAQLQDVGLAGKRGRGKLQEEQLLPEHRRQHAEERHQHLEGCLQHVHQGRRVDQQTCEGTEREGHACESERYCEALAAEQPGHTHVLQVIPDKQQQQEHGMNTRALSPPYSDEPQQLTRVPSLSEGQALSLEPSKGATPEVFARPAETRRVAAAGCTSHQQGLWQGAGEQTEERFEVPRKEQRTRQDVLSGKQHPQEQCTLGATKNSQCPSELAESTEIELDEDVCDFLEADLPPAAVARWSDYLRLREQQQRRYQQPLPRLRQEQWQDRRLEGQPPRLQGQRNDFIQAAASPFHRASRHQPSGGPSVEEKVPREVRLTGSPHPRSESASASQESPFFPAATWRQCRPCSPPLSYSASRTPPRPPPGARAAHSDTRTLAVCSSTSGVQRIDACAANDAYSSSERFVSIGTAGASSTTTDCAGSSTGARCCTIMSCSVGGGQQGRIASGVVARGSREPTSVSCIKPKGDVCGAFPATSSARAAFVGTENVQTAAMPAFGSGMAETEGSASETPALQSCHLFLSRGGTHKRNYVQSLTASAPESGLRKDSEVPYVRTTSNTMSSEGSGHGSARIGCRTAARYGEWQSQGHPCSASSASASALPPASLAFSSSFSARAPSSQRLLTAAAVTVGAGDGSTGTRRPVPLEAFFQLRINRSAGAAAHGRLPLLSVNDAAAAHPRPGVDHAVVSQDDRLPLSAPMTLSRTTERSGDGRAAARFVASSDPPATSPSAAVTSACGRAPDSCPAPPRSSEAADHGEAGWQSVIESDVLTGEPQVVSPDTEADRNTRTDPESVGALEPGDEEPRQSGVALAVNPAESSATSHSAARRPLRKTVDGSRRRRGGGTAAYDRGGSRRFIYLKPHEECSVCFVEIRIKGEAAVVEDCRHCFCCACLARWIKKSRTCPLCRRPVTTVELWRQTPGALTKNPLSYAFLRRLRPDKNNVLKPVAVSSKKTVRQSR